MKRIVAVFIILIAACAALFAADMLVGTVEISLQQLWAAITGGNCPEGTRQIIVGIRLTKALVAILVGAALSVSGLQMQTLFRNPLAGPYVLGVSSGASLGVALFVLGAPILPASPWLQQLGIAGAAWLGSALILMAIAIIGQRVKDIMVILILGIMFSSGISAVVQALQYLSQEEALKSFVVWTMGSLSDVTAGQLTILTTVTIIGLIISAVTIKPLNLMLLGEEYARTMGLNIKRSRTMIFAVTTLLAGSVTAFCGPIGFIGMAIPHVARLSIRQADHRFLLPATMLCGIVAMLLCDIMSKMLLMPINVVTSLLGIPIVIWVVMKNKSI
ncbi:MAG: iron ABC transporter permease [Muribaculum sp.]|nr:iron ABC transporter permease [Muribaculaceae bacterium]MCM1080447.1 iron ABC transporter permease [Muribaculum sp.]